MGSGKWEMGNGKWEMGNGKWALDPKSAFYHRLKPVAINSCCVAKKS